MINENKRIITFGELMLRLTPPEHGTLFGAQNLNVTFGGAEADTAVTLANLGEKIDFVSALPDNDLGRSAMSELRRHNVGTSNIRQTEGRMGIYFTEAGVDFRPSEVLYDRDDSAASRLCKEELDWKAIFAYADWFHLSGITPAISKNLCEAALEAATEAKAAGLTVSFDINYRKNLWKWGADASDTLPKFVSCADVLFAGKDECVQFLGVRNIADDVGFFKALTSRYSSVKVVVSSVRKGESADANIVSGICQTESGVYHSREYALNHIVDRLGSGDAFAGAFIFALRNEFDNQKAIEFATAAAALKHTTYGDFSRFTRADVENLAGGAAASRVKR
jgi:2-dehydro-3-deoxygluconokinase